MFGRAKAGAVLVENPDAVVIGADTMVCIDGECLGKPHDREEAAHMLRRLSESHQVITAVSIQTHDRKETFCDTTEVTF